VCVCEREREIEGLIKKTELRSLALPSLRSNSNLINFTPTGRDQEKSHCAVAIVTQHLFVIISNT